MKNLLKDICIAEHIVQTSTYFLSKFRILQSSMCFYVGLVLIIGYSHDDVFLLQRPEFVFFFHI